MCVFFVRLEFSTSFSVVFTANFGKLVLSAHFHISINWCLFCVCVGCYFFFLLSHWMTKQIDSGKTNIVPRFQLVSVQFFFSLWDLMNVHILLSFCRCLSFSLIFFSLRITRIFIVICLYLVNNNLVFYPSIVFRLFWLGILFDECIECDIMCLWF